MGPCLNFCNESFQYTISFQSFFFLILLQSVCVFSPSDHLDNIRIGKMALEGSCL